MTRVTYDNSEYRKAKAELDKKLDGLHCIICDKEIPGLKKPDMRRKYCTRKCFNDWYSTIAPPRSWGDLRYHTLERDKYTCQKCGTAEKDNPDKRYEVDHIVPLCHGGEMWDRKNLQTLCYKCHKAKTKIDVRVRLSDDQTRLNDN